MFASVNIRSGSLPCFFGGKDVALWKLIELTEFNFNTIDFQIRSG